MEHRSGFQRESGTQGTPIRRAAGAAIGRSISRPQRSAQFCVAEAQIRRAMWGLWLRSRRPPLQDARRAATRDAWRVAASFAVIVARERTNDRATHARDDSNTTRLDEIAVQIATARATRHPRAVH